MLVPVLAEGEVETRPDPARTWGLLRQVGAVMSLAARRLLTSAYGGGSPGHLADDYSLAVGLTESSCAAAVAAAIVLRAECRARRSFRPRGGGDATPTSRLLILVWALPRYGVRAAAWIMVLRVALPVGFMWPVLGGWRRPRWWSESRAEALRRVKPLLLGGLYNHIPPLVTRQLASLAPAGGLSLLTASQHLYARPTR